MVLGFYHDIRDILSRDHKGILLVVIHHDGSSPGRKGFQMFVSSSSMLGTIGGGIMEHKLVTLAKELLHKDESFAPFVKRQIHQADLAEDRSGMICSGEQSVAFYPIDHEFTKLLTDDSSIVGLVADTNQVRLFSTYEHEIQYVANKSVGWKLFFPIKGRHRVHIIGAGHVGLALSQVLSILDFEVHVYDDRPDLHTLTANHYTGSKHIVDYHSIDQKIPEGENEYVAITSFGYRTDKIIISRLLDKNYKYIGMLGSKSKIKQLWQELIAEGHDAASLGKVSAPIGVDILCETAQDIAISIAAELIDVRNKR